MNVLEILNSIKKNNATTFAVVPATLTLLVNNFPEKFVEKCIGLRLIITNSTKVPEDTINKILNLRLDMATVYKIEIVSDWIDYTEEEFKKLIEENLDPDRQNIRVTEIERK